MNEVLQKMHDIGIIPVVVLNDAKDAAPLGKALLEGGLPCAEVTFRTDAAEESIRIMSEKFPELLVGAGTVLTIDQVDRAVAAGARFIVSPGLNPKIVQYCTEKQIPITPGVVTPGEIEKAIELGLEVVKFFPAEPSGGLSMINAVGAAYTAMKFMPTGGITAKNAADYLKSGKIHACGGSWMVKTDYISACEFGKITELCREAAQIVKNART
ncbi:MAG: bifunctional 4-hydroxy-2-oxoglutarate aldolase/2-dehydro-3-deoxy-phosphogluconate aldolase [Lachnospiraceae bacterium]|nr:bifunctional 4-hydroxy-2-oxoglutarate aldolase/2-dehydro-3-deoxy-phosphogluconate aldolase [Lachnospiraceae bacterium]